jgi:hypothetical protein
MATTTSASRLFWWCTEPPDRADQHEAPFFSTQRSIAAISSVGTLVERRFMGAIRQIALSQPDDRVVEEMARE